MKMGMQWLLTTVLQLPTADILLSSEQCVILLHSCGDCIGSLKVGMRLFLIGFGFAAKLWHKHYESFSLNGLMYSFETLLLIRFKPFPWSQSGKRNSDKFMQKAFFSIKNKQILNKVLFKLKLSWGMLKIATHFLLPSLIHLSGTAEVWLRSCEQHRIISLGFFEVV